MVPVPDERNQTPLTPAEAGVRFFGLSLGPRHLKSAVADLSN
jgi:hypothetical protein